MEERSLKVYSSDKTFFSKITNSLTKMFIPTKVGINGVMISIKRNNVLKGFENYLDVVEQDDGNKKEAQLKKYEDVYALYLEAIDKYIIDSIYKKVKNDTASEFEKNALSRYYNVIHLKDTEYLEYKYRKQKYLLELDYETVEILGKEKLLERYKFFYSTKMDTLYKGLLKNYSIKLAENLTSSEKDEIYNKIFDTLDEYIARILPIKVQNDEISAYDEIINDLETVERYQVGKLDQVDTIEKKMVLLSISRKIFTHSLPLIVAEQCYIKLIKSLRSIIVETRILKKQEKAYRLLIDLMDNYNEKLLSTKIYWDKPALREEYKEFSNKLKAIEKYKKDDFRKYNREKEILFIKYDLQRLYTKESKYGKIIKFYRRKLVDYGVLRQFKNSCVTGGYYTKEKDVVEDNDEEFNY